MGFQLLPLPAIVLTSPLSRSPKLPNFHCRRSIHSRTAATNRWNSSRGPASNGGFGLDSDDELEGDFGGGGRQRAWWSDYDDDDDDDDFDIDEGDEFWVFKVLKGFGWMVPAIAISLLLGTGPNAFIMALAVPLGQTVISLAFDKVWGMTNDSPNPRARSKSWKKPSAGTASNYTRTTAGARQQNGPRETYQSWVSGDGTSSNKKDNKNARTFGGWDDLDRKTGTYDVPRGRSNRKNAGLEKLQKRGKASRIGRVKERPLLLRLLIAAFPFLGSWTKLLF